MPLNLRHWTFSKGVDSHSGFMKINPVHGCGSVCPRPLVVAVFTEVKCHQSLELLKQSHINHTQTPDIPWSCWRCLGGCSFCAFSGGFPDWAVDTNTEVPCATQGHTLTIQVGVKLTLSCVSLLGLLVALFQAVTLHTVNVPGAKVHWDLRLSLSISLGLWRLPSGGYG